MRLPSTAPVWFQRLSRRERVLTLLVAGSAFLIVNLLAINFLLDAYTSLTRQYTDDQGSLFRLKALADQQGIWSLRSDWLKSTQPVLINRDRAGTALYEQVQSLARAKQIMLNSLQIKAAATNPAGASVKPEGDAVQVVSVEAATQGDWKETVHFLTDLQKPDNFIVFERANLHSNPSDPKQMIGSFLVSKWYAPAAK